MNDGIWTEAYRRGDHAIQVYSCDKERLRTVCDILEWIDRDEILIYIVDDLGLDFLNHGDSSIVRRIKEGIAQGRLRLMSATPFYLENGAFNLEVRIAEWKNILNEIQDEGYKGLVVVGDLSWSANNPGLFSEVLRYEAALSIAGLPKGFTAVCQYDSRLFSQKEIDYIESVHELQLKEGNLQRNFWLVSKRYY
ncbi:MAG: hypothetical protein GKC03_08825 [Methanomassiliicoccales archaeon]|nr:hypothetical protein [Methanomassiliicoccales archaeon]NYT15385.1 hypothetical protein [Methanomassiliicoccales archaeon]